MLRHCSAVTDDRGGVPVDNSKNKPFWLHIHSPVVWEPRRGVLKSSQDFK